MGAKRHAAWPPFSLLQAQAQKHASSRTGSGVEARHFGEGLSLQRGTSDEGAINVGLSHELLDVARLRGAAVKDTSGLSGFSSEVLCEGLADRAAHFLRILGGRGLTRADRPDRR